MKQLLQIGAIVIFISCHPDRTDVSEKTTRSETNSSESAFHDGNNSDSRSVRFHNYEYVEEIKAQNETEWKRYTNDSVRLKVKQIAFIGYNTIPDSFKIFENIEKVYLRAGSGTKGLDNYHKLREIEFFDTKAEIDPGDKWLRGIRIFKATKTQVHGLTSFTSMPNLTHLELTYAGFDRFPLHLDSLRCLQELILASTSGNLDLAIIDLSRLPHLRKAEFVTWTNNLSGIPKGLEDSTTNVELTVDHQRLTKREKNKLRVYSERFKKASH